MHFEDLVQFLGARHANVSARLPTCDVGPPPGRNGRASVQDVARALLNEDRSQLSYDSDMTKNMVGRVLANRAVVKREGGDYQLLGYDRFTAEQVQELKAICDRKLAEYIARGGEAIWEHRRRSAGYVSGTLRYEVLKNAKVRCELGGVSIEERALEGGPHNASKTKEVGTRSATFKPSATAATR